MANYLITGASRGIGLELTKQLLALPASQVGKVVTLTRSKPSGSLADLIGQHKDRVTSVTAAFDSQDSLTQAASSVQSSLGGHGLDVLVNNAGASAFNMEGTRTMPDKTLTELLDVNVTAVHRVTVAFLPLLEAGEQKKVINVSSTLGAISWAHKFKLSPNPAYKVSKAALHMLNAQYALDLGEKGFTFLLISPGWLKTDLGGEHADLPVETGVAELKRIILAATQAQNGKFLNIHVPGQEEAWGRYDGGEIEW